MLPQMMNSLWKHPKTAAFIAGAIATSALPPFYCFPVLFFCFSLLLLLLGKQTTFKSAFMVGYAFGFSFYAFGFYWIGNALLVEAETFGWLIPFVFFACGAFFGLFTAFPAGLTWLCKNSEKYTITFACWWTIFEWVRGWFLTGFPWNPIGSVLAFDNVWLQEASIGGTYFLSWLVLWLAGLPYYYISNPSFQRLGKVLFLATAVILSVYSFGYNRLNTTPQEKSSIRLRLVQPAIPQTLKWNRETEEYNFQKYIQMSAANGLKDINFVIWGETASPFPLQQDLQHLKQVTLAVPENGYLITGSLRYEINKDGTHVPYNSMLVINKSGDIVASYDKSHLVPFGEYIPLREYLPQWVRPITKVIGTFGRGNGPERIELPNIPSFGGLVCYEIIFPGEIINKDKRPKWLVNLTNDGWYGDSSGPRQHLVSARMRAIEEGMAIARVANTGISAVISPYGEIIAQLDLNVSGIIDVDLPPPSQFSTIYSRVGNSFILILCSALLMLVYSSLFMSNKGDK